MEMPGDVIAMSTYNEVTIEAWYTPRPVQTRAGRCWAISAIASTAWVAMATS